MTGHLELCRLCFGVGASFIHYLLERNANKFKQTVAVLLGLYMSRNYINKYKINHRIYIYLNS